MGSRVWGDRISTGDFEALKAYQVFKLNKNYNLLAVRVNVIIYNSPTFNYLQGNIYSVSNSQPSILIASSDNILKPADVFTLASGIKEVYFEFKKPFGLKLYGLDQIAFVLSANGYIGDATSHLALQKAWPDPVHKVNFTPTFENLSVAPRRIALIGAKA